MSLKSKGNVNIKPKLVCKIANKQIFKFMNVRQKTKMKLDHRH